MPLKVVEQSPLVLSDYWSSRQNVVTCDLIYPHTVTEIYLLEYSADQRWYFLDKQAPNELWFLKITDSVAQTTDSQIAGCKSISHLHSVIRQS
jgi:hypothetical protein